MWGGGQLQSDITQEDDEIKTVKKRAEGRKGQKINLRNGCEEQTV